MYHFRPSTWWPCKTPHSRLLVVAWIKPLRWVHRKCIRNRLSATRQNWWSWCVHLRLPSTWYLVSTDLCTFRSKSWRYLPYLHHLLPHKRRQVVRWNKQGAELCGCPHILKEMSCVIHHLKDFHGPSLFLHNGRTKFLLFGHSCTGMQGKQEVISCRVYADRCPTLIFLSSSDPGLFDCRWLFQVLMVVDDRKTNRSFRNQFSEALHPDTEAWPLLW